MDLVDLDPTSATAPFEQVRSQIATAIEAGNLQPAVRLPPVRRLASELGLAVNTVARAYRELELAGFVETQGRHGTFVASPSSTDRSVAISAVRAFVLEMRQLGVGDAETLALVRRQLENGASPRSDRGAASVRRSAKC
jgi:DNA-binding transcriptional regulator YhcF (GntR family)